MNLNIIKHYDLVENCLCSNVKTKYISVKNFTELRDILIEYGYDDVPYTLDAKVDNNTIVEDVSVSCGNNLVNLDCDNTKVSYDQVKFMVKVYCNNNAVIMVKDQGEYCEKCYKQIPNVPKLNIVYKVLKENDPFKGLSVSKKIQFILKKGDKLTSTQIFEEGKPWEAIGKTPKNTIAARCSTLCQKGFIKKEGSFYYSGGNG